MQLSIRILVRNVFETKLFLFGAAPMPGWCIHYARTRPAAATVLYGCDKTDQVNAVIAYVQHGKTLMKAPPLRGGAEKHLKSTL